MRYGIVAVRRLTILAATASAVLLLAQQTTEAQARAKVNVAQPSQETEVARLKRRVDSLEARIEELEAGDVEEVKDDASAEVEARKVADALERRLARIEQELEAVRTSPSQNQKGARESEVSSLTVRAPFTVVDGAGRPIMRVLDNQTSQSSRGAYIYDQSGTSSVAHIGALPSGGGRVYVSRPKQESPRIILAADDDASLLSIKGNAGQVLYLGTKDSRGYFELADAAGNKMVEAGSLVSGKGYVLVNPWKTSTSLDGNPSVLMGGGGKKQ